MLPGDPISSSGDPFLSRFVAFLRVFNAFKNHIHFLSFHYELMLKYALMLKPAASLWFIYFYMLYILLHDFTRFYMFLYFSYILYTFIYKLISIKIRYVMQLHLLFALYFRQLALPKLYCIPRNCSPEHLCSNGLCYCLTSVDNNVLHFIIVPGKN